MSKKLLSEAQVRRFQSLASIKPLQEMGHYAEEESNEGLYQEEVVSEEEAPEMDMADAEGPEEEAPEMDMADADGDEVDMTSDDLSAVADALDTLSSKLAPLLDAVDAPEEEAEMPAMEPSADAGEEDEEEPAGAMDDVLQEALKGIEYEPSQGEIVKAVALRVAKRLQEAKKAQAKLDKALGRK